MFNIVLFQPEIPPNTGNIIRLCANTGCTLHLIRPLGFDLDDKKLRRAGLDYHEWATVKHYDDMQALRAEIARTSPGSTEYAVSTRGKTTYSDADFRHGDCLVFGPETRGLPADYLQAMPPHTVCCAYPCVLTAAALTCRIRYRRWSMKR